MRKTFCSISLVALLFASFASDAALLTKELSHVTFDDGGTATGFMVFDTTSKQITQFDILTTSGISIDSSFEYRADTARIVGQSNEPGSGWPNSFVQLVSLPGQDSAGNHELFLTFSGPLTAGESSSILYGGGLGTISYEREFLGEHLQKLRMVRGPEVVGLPAIPEPSQLTWLALGVCLTYGLRRIIRRSNA